MNINEFPNEILDQILEEATKLNERAGVEYTYGLSQAPQPFKDAKIHRYVRGMIPPDVKRWDAASSIRQVCPAWHEWALDYSLSELYIKKWRKSERWANLPQRQTQYSLYEIAEDKTGPYVYKDPFLAIRKTATFLRNYPHVASKVRRLWLNEFRGSETDADISSIIRSCTNLTSASMPSTVIRRLPASELQRLLISDTGVPLETLELQAVDLDDVQKQNHKNLMNFHPLDTVDFSTLRRLKLIGDSVSLPVTDDDLVAIARTATNLEEFHITCMSSISIKGVMAIVEASQKTLRVLEHSPRSQDGFFHPHPGYLPSSDHHICEIIASCPRLESLSISIPSMCATLFSNPAVRWRGDCQVRAAHLCGNSQRTARARSDAFESHNSLSKLLAAGRNLINTRACSVIPVELYIELFFADCIFEPGFSAVHGVFEYAGVSSHGAWPRERAPSRKGPYGSTGLYGKDDAELLEDEEEQFERVEEREFLRGVMNNWVTVDV